MKELRILKAAEISQHLMQQELIDLLQLGLQAK